MALDNESHVRLLSLSPILPISFLKQFGLDARSHVVDAHLIAKADDPHYQMNWHNQDFTEKLEHGKICAAGWPTC